jgi:peptide/nickel transport system permease protein
MLNYVLRRLLYLIPTILGVAALIFTLFHAAGDDPVRVALGQHASAEAIADLEAKWGLDKSLPMQFLDFLEQIVTLNFGFSYNTGDQLSEMFSQGAWVSLSLMLPPYLIGLLLNLTIALYVAYFRGGWLDRFATATTVMLMSVSYLVYIIAFQYLLAFEADLFPINGYDYGLDAIPYLVLPGIIILVVGVGPDVRIYRTVFLDEMKADYVRTARAKGVGESALLFKHVLKNAMIPILTYTMVAIPFLIMGSFLMERFFSIPGVGDLMINAINTGDFPVLKGLSMYIAIGYSLFNLLTDVLYAFVDPRVKLS